MINVPYLDLDIIKRQRKFYIIITDNIARRELGPFKTRQQAQKMFDECAREAAKLGGVSVAVGTSKIPRSKRRAA